MNVVLFVFFLRVVDSANTIWIKNLVEIALSHAISEINTFLRFTRKIKIAAKNSRKTIF